ncbi:hypothetical protein GCM10023199_34370 [Actinomycetospora chibensis]
MPAVGSIAILWTLLWVALQALIGGGAGYLATLFAGRNEVNSEIQTNVPNLVGALPMVGAIMVCIVRLRISSSRPLKVSERLWFWMAVALALIPPLALGTRRFILPVLVALLLCVSTNKWKRVLSPRIFLPAIVVTLLLMVTPFVRSEGSRGESDSLVGAALEYVVNEGVGEPVRQFFVSYDTEMFNYVALSSIARQSGYPYGYGEATIGEAAVAALPANLSPEDLFSDQFLQATYGGSCGQPYCPVPSIVGLLMNDLDLVGVVIGMTLLGVILAQLSRPKFNPPYRVGVLTLTLWAGVPTLIRGNGAKLLPIYLEVAVLAGLSLVALSLFVRRQRLSAPSAFYDDPAGYGKFESAQRNRLIGADGV